MELVLGLFLYFNLVYLVGLYKDDFSIIDIAWGPSFLIVFLVGFYCEKSMLDVRLITLGFFVFLWGIRLSFYILIRSLKRGTEDYRYAQWREEWGEKVNLIAYFKVYMLQALLAGLIASPLYLVHLYSSKPFGTWNDFLGIILFVFGLSFETISDYQKNKFKLNPKNHSKILKSGLWKYSRHPNYFGEAMIWWGVFCIVISTVPIYLAVWGPLIINFFLLKISGVSLLEKKYQGNNEYEEYKKQTNAFIPFVKKGRVK